MFVYGVTAFLSAFLLFQVQLMLAKHILPWFGGAPAVWTTCMLFFQSALLAGYAYAHWLADRTRPGTQRTLHLLVLGVSAVALVALAVTWGVPLLPDSDWRPTEDTEPIGHIITLLAVSVGVPFLVLAATAPLLQSWFSRTQNGSPYPLYAFSNAGSLAGLLTYPFLIEAFFSLRTQAALWVGAYALFGVGIAYCALRFAARAGGDQRAPTAGRRTAERSPPQRLDYWLWFALPACASVLLLAVTNQLSHAVGVVPLLWIVPLALYLFSFVLSFGGRRGYSRRIYGALLAPAIALATLLFQEGSGAAIPAQIALYGFALFVCSMVCHGELARLKPRPRHLTAFYLTITAGGAAGGLFVGVAAPYLFPGYWELLVGLWLAAALLVAAMHRDRGSMLYRGPVLPAAAALLATVLFGGLVVADALPRVGTAAGNGHDTMYRLVGAMALALLAGGSAAVTWVRLRRPPALRTVATIAGEPAVGRGFYADARSTARSAALFAAALVLLAGTYLVVAWGSTRHALAIARNFYGLLHVVQRDTNDREESHLELRHGRVVHGLQFAAPERRAQASAYYGPDSGVGLALLNHPRRLAGMPHLRIGVIGLGVGTVAAYGRPGDYLRFYEINPDVIRLAAGRDAMFSYVRDTPADVDIVVGDARLSLHRELAAHRPQSFDVLIVDAFSSGAIPMHLLTREAFEIYLQHLNTPDGILAVHVSSHHLDLAAVVARLARHFRLEMRVVDSSASELEFPSEWALLARDAIALSAAPIVAGALPESPRPGPLWTDDHSNLFRVIRIRGGSNGDWLDLEFALPDSPLLGDLH